MYGFVEFGGDHPHGRSSGRLSKEARFGLSSPTLPAMNPPDPSTIKAESWEKAEETAREIVRRIQPTVRDYQRRLEIIEYVRTVIRVHLGVQVIHDRLISGI